MNMEKASIIQLSWQDIRIRVRTVNPDLADIIDQIDPGSEFFLYLARYPYGSPIMKQGIFQMPMTDGRVAPAYDSAVAAHVKGHFSDFAQTLPCGMLLTNTLHNFISTHDQTAPLAIVQAGELFGWSSFLDAQSSFYPSHLCSMTAGARFVFMLPNISDRALHKNLKNHYRIAHPPPKHLLEHWDIFKSLVQHPNSECDWQCEVVFFTTNWLKNIRQNPDWQALYLYLLQFAWKKTAYERNHIFYEAALSALQAKKNLKLNPYMASTIKQLFMIASGATPGYGVATDDLSAPIALLQKIYLDSYGLKYNPTIFLPKHFEATPSASPIYYSLVMPSVLEFSQKSSKKSTIMQDLVELRDWVGLLLEEVQQNPLFLGDSRLNHILQRLEFEFFHCKPDRHEEIQLTSRMPEGDPSLLQCLHDSKPRDFSAAGSLIRGCVRMRAHLSSEVNA